MTENTHLCEDIIDRLMTVLRQGGELSAEDRAHLAVCPKCGRILSAARQLHEEIETHIPAGGSDEERLASVTREAQAALRTTRWRHFVITLIAVCVILLAWLLVPIGMLAVPEKLIIFIVVAILILLATVVFLILRRLFSRTSRRKLYRRLKRGRLLAGVCLGLSEVTGISVWAIRAVFIGLLFVGKIGLPLYLILVLALEVHPEDRGHLVQFTLKRWMKRFFTPSKLESNSARY